MLTRRSLLTLLPGVLLAAQGDYLVYFGTYTRDKSKGIYAYRFQPATGKLEPLGLAAETVNPSFLTIHQNRRHLYAVGETGNYEGQKSGLVSAFSMDLKTGKLTLLNKRATRGTSPCHLAIDKTGKTLIVVNYGTGSTIAYPIQSDGSLGAETSFIQHSGSSANPKRQQGPHAHSVNISDDNRFAVVADLGLDQVLVYRLDAATGKLSPNDPPSVKVNPGAGPRHFNFHPNGKYAYVINELQSTVTAFSWDGSRGVLTEIQTISTLPKDFTGDNTTAEVRVHPSGQFLYGSNRGHNSLAIFAIDPSKGTLTPVGHQPTQGQIPRNFNFDPTGAYVFAANQNSDNVVVFKLDQKTGKFSPTSQVLEIGAPVCVRFVAAD